MKRFLQCVALVLVLVLVLAGCFGGLDDYELFMLRQFYESQNLVDYEDMEYERPDMTEFQQVLEESCRLALEADRVEDIIDGVYAFYDVYDWFYTNYFLADIRYSADLTDIYWEQEYNYCEAQSATADAGLDELFYTLADSPLREELEAEEYFGPGYFDAYEGESIWDEYFVDLMEQESALINQYYDLSAQALDAMDAEQYYEVYGTQMGQVLVELVTLRQEIARYAGYDSYVQFAYDFYYYRDYTPDQVTVYLDEILAELVDLYVGLDNETVWNAAYRASSERETYAYVKSCAENMGGVVKAAFEMLDKYGLYDISYGENKYNSSFEVFLFSYCEPFVFMNAQGWGWDKLTFAHEFGHFANDYACVGSYAGTDVSEVFSQAMEYLSLLYADGGEKLTNLKLADCLCTYVEQAAYAAFEHQLYELSDPTVEDVETLYADVCRAYGFESWEWDSRSYVDVTHFYTNPMYIISYVVSNDAAFQMYQMELAEEGAGLELMSESLYNQDGWFLNFVDNIGLESPFADGRVKTVRQTLEDALK